LDLENINVEGFGLYSWFRCIPRKDKNNDDEKEVELVSVVFSMRVKEAYRRSKVIT